MKMSKMCLQLYFGNEPLEISNDDVYIGINDVKLQEDGNLFIDTDTLDILIFAGEVDRIKNVLGD